MKKPRSKPTALKLIERHCKSIELVAKQLERLEKKLDRLPRAELDELISESDTYLMCEAMLHERYSDRDAQELIACLAAGNGYSRVLRLLAQEERENANTETSDYPQDDIAVANILEIAASSLDALNADINKRLNRTGNHF